MRERERKGKTYWGNEAAEVASGRYDLEVQWRSKAGAG